MYLLIQHQMKVHQFITMILALQVIITHKKTLSRKKAIRITISQMPR